MLSDVNKKDSPFIVWVGLTHFSACDDSKSNNNTQDAGNEETAGEVTGVL